MKYKTHIPNILLTLACICCYAFLPPVGYGHGIGIVGALCYSFHHCNIFHLLTNLCALWLFRPRLHTLIIAYVTAVITALIPITWMDAGPTYGLSAIIFACYARMYVAWQKNVWRIILIQALVSLIPGINWRAHIAAFIISLLYWLHYYGRKSI